MERFIRTIKMMIRKRIEHDMKQGKTDIQWHNYIFQTILTYNEKNEHSTIGMTPAEAINEDNQLEANMNMVFKARRDRTYPPLTVGSKG